MYLYGRMGHVRSQEHVSVGVIMRRLGMSELPVKHVGVCFVVQFLALVLGLGSIHI